MIALKCPVCGNLTEAAKSLKPNPSDTNNARLEAEIKRKDEAIRMAVGHIDEADMVLYFEGLRGNHEARVGLNAAEDALRAALAQDSVKPSPKPADFKHGVYATRTDKDLD